MTSIPLLFVAAALGAEPDLAWKQMPDSLVLTRGDRVVWQFNYKTDGASPISIRSRSPEAPC